MIHRAALALLLCVCLAPTHYGSGSAGGAISGGQLLKVDIATEVRSEPSTLYRPSIMLFGNETEGDYAHDLFSAYSDTGIVRAEDFYYPQNCASPAANDYACSATTSDALTRFRSYLLETRIANTVSEGTVVLYVGPWNGGYAASTTPSVFLNAEPDDTSDSGAYEVHVACLAEMALTSDANICGSGLTGVNYATATSVGDPGILFAGPNEVNGSWAETQATYSATMQAIYRAITSVDAGAYLVVPDMNDITPNVDYLDDTLVDFAGLGYTQVKVSVHCFRAQVFSGTGCSGLEAIKAAVDSAVSAASLSPAPELLSLEIQVSGGSPAGMRYTETSAAGLASWLMNADRNGWAGITAVSYKLGDDPADDDAYDESGSFAGWGYCPRLTTTSAYRAGCVPSFMLMSLFQNWAGCPEVLVSPNELNKRKIDGRAWLCVNSVWMLASRWDVDNPNALSLTLEGACPSGQSLSESRIYRFEDGVNDPEYTYANNGGTDAEDAAASRVTAETVTYATGASLRQTETLEQREAVVVQWVCS